MNILYGWIKRNGGMIRLWAGLCLMVLTCCFSVSIVQAEIYVGPGETYTIIQAGLDAAVSGDTVIVRSGTYTGDGNKDLDFRGKAIILRSESGPESTIIDCGGTGRGFWFRGSGMAGSVVDGFTIKNGQADKVGGSGGGIFIEDASPTITNCIITQNTGRMGGGLCIRNGNPTVSHCIFSGNTAIDQGGGIYIYWSPSPAISDCSISGNTARIGAGIYIHYSSPAIKNSDLLNNSASEIGGGISIYGKDGGISKISQCNLSGNTANAGGAGIYINEASAAITQCDISNNNSAYDGGGMLIRNVALNNQSVAVSNCVISKNKADSDNDNLGRGGGIVIESSIARILNCTIIQNNGYKVGGLYNNSDSTLVANTIIRDNTDTDSASSNENIFNIRTITVGSSNIEGNYPGLGNIDIDPRFQDPAAGDFHLKGNSPCINAGTMKVEGLPTEDMDGDPRPFFSKMDIGVDEFTGAYTDSDTDGLPDYWEYYFFGDNDLTQGADGDPDADSLSNKEELRNYTNPDFNDTTVFVDGTAGDDAYHGRSWRRAKKTIQAGLDAAESGITVLVLPGTYKGNGNKNLNFKGKALTLKPKAGSPASTIDCESDGRAFHFNSGEKMTSVVDGFTIINGNADNGGGILIETASSPAIKNCFFLTNQATNEGGGIYIQNGSSPRILNCTFSENHSVSGGGMRNGGADAIENCLFEKNTASSSGGGMLNTSDASRIINCQFNQNNAASGGGVYNSAASAFINCTFNQNTSGQQGGGMFNVSGRPAIENCTFTRNTANTDGAGMVNNGGSSTIKKCSFTQNSAALNGGAVSNFNGASPVITNTVIYQNAAAQNGGGMFNSNASPVIVNSTFYSNTAIQTGGQEMHNAAGSSPKIVNCILWRDAAGSILINASSTPIFQNSNIRGSGGSFNWDSRYGTDNGRNIDIDPRLADPANGNFHLKDDSPCLNAGINTFNSPDVVPDHDVENDPRPFDDAAQLPETQRNKPDMGADEFTGTYRDSDADGLPDFWEYYCFNGPAKYGSLDDPDTDGKDNASEFQEGTDPFYRQEIIFVDGVTGDDANNGHTGTLAKKTIQAGLDAARNGNTVIAMAGTYSGAGNQNLDFKGKTVVLRSEDGARAVIDPGCAPDGSNCTGGRRGFWFHNGETNASMVERFVIKNGYAMSGAGMNLDGSSPTIRDVVFESNNAAYNGGGIYAANGSAPFIERCTFRNNKAINGGGGLSAPGTSPKVVNSLFYGNTADHGGGMDIGAGSAGIIFNCTIFGNRADYFGGGIYNQGGTPQIINTIVYDNTNGEVVNHTLQRVVVGPQALVRRSNVKGGGGSGENWNPVAGEDGGGNLDIDPLFKDAGNGDFHLKGDSPMIDGGMLAGAPETDMDGDPRPAGPFADIGTDEVRLEDFIDADHDGLPDFWEKRYYASIADCIPSGNTDGDPKTNQQEYNEGTDPARGDDYKMERIILVNGKSGDDSSPGYSRTLAKRTIQAGLDEAQEGYVVLVLAGTYTGEGNRKLNFKGKNVTLRSESGSNETVIDCGGERGFKFSMGETNQTVVEGFTIRNGGGDYGGGMDISYASPTIAHCIFSGNSASKLGGGIYIYKASPVIRNCIFSGNTAPTAAQGCGGGLYIKESSPAITHCTFSGNSASTAGGGIYITSSSVITNCVLSGNTATGYGGGIYIENSDSAVDVVITNCTIYGNSGKGGGGIYNYSGSVEITSTIVWGNAGGEISNRVSTSPVIIRHSDIQGSGGSLAWNTAIGEDDGGNLDVVPGFKNAANGDFHLMGDSPLINAGTNEDVLGVDMDGDSRPQGASADIGADEVLLKDYTDADNDSLPDYWEKYYFGIPETFGPDDDPDEDQAATLEEFKSKTDPVELIFVNGTSGNDVNHGYLRSSPKKTIQAGLNAAARKGQTVLVLAGTYTGAGNTNLDFKGKGVTLRSESGPAATIIDCQFTARGFYFHTHEGVDSVVDGFTIQKGKHATSGGGIFIDVASPSIANCIFSQNESGVGGAIGIISGSPVITYCQLNNSISSVVGNGTSGGGGIYAYFSSPIISFCQFSANRAYDPGGGIFIDTGSPVITRCNFFNNISTGNNGGGIMAFKSSLTISNCLFSGNQSVGGGAGCMIAQSSVTMANCTIYGNTLTSGISGGGIGGYSGSGIIANSIIWGNTGSQIYFISSEPAINYSNVQGGYSGTGNINTTPKFVNAANLDFRLMADSPCVNAGTSVSGMYSDIRGSLRPAGANPLQAGSFDMGAYEYAYSYSGSEDAVTKAFKDIQINTTSLMPGYDYDVSWKNKSPFPYSDGRITQAAEYAVNFVLFGARGRRVIAENIVVPSQLAAEKYTHKVRFTNDHIGDWNLRIELSNDPSQFAESQPITISPAQVQNWTIGEEILPPVGAATRFEPKISNGNANFYWHGPTQKLYAVGPTTATITWLDDQAKDGPQITGATVWPSAPQIHVADSAPVILIPEGSPYSGVDIHYTDFGDVQDKKFTAEDAGYSVLRFTELNQDADPHFVIVKSIAWNDLAYIKGKDWDIGTEIVPDSAFGHASQCGQGYVINEISPYAPATAGVVPPDGHDQPNRRGPIVPVNLDNDPASNNDLVVVWYSKDDTGICWPGKPVRYIPRWPQQVSQIVIGNTEGSGDTLNGKANVQIYNQPDPTKPGFNPNEEHAVVDVGIVFALRNDLNARIKANKDPGSPPVSEPYVIARYQIPEQNNRWEFRAFKVVRGNFQYNGTAGQVVQAPLPLNKFAACEQTNWNTQDNLLWWKDYNENSYARVEGTGILHFYYPLQDGFFYDLDLNGQNDLTAGECIPWLDNGTGTPVDASYNITWPDEPLVLHVGDSLIGAQTGLEINGQCSVDVIYDQSFDSPASGATPKRSVKLLEILSDRSVPLGEAGQRVDQVLPSDMAYQETGGGNVIFPDLPPHLYRRVMYNYVQHRLIFRGYYDDTLAGKPLLLPNIMMDSEKILIQGLTDDTGVSGTNFKNKVTELYNETRGDHLNGETKIVGTDNFKILSAAFPNGGSGYVTVAFNNDENACRGNPVALKVIKVECASLDPGELKFLPAENVFDERVTFVHSNDFAGSADGLTFEWAVCTPDHGNQPDPPGTVNPQNPCDWVSQPGGLGANYYMFGGTGLQVLEDKWVTVRYKGYNDRCPCTGEACWSGWTSPRFNENWIKRVITALNPFEQRFKNFHENAAATYVSMIQQAGPRYEGDVALNDDPNYLNSIGLIELYTTVLNRGLELSVNGSPPQSTPKSNEALLFAASRISDIYTLLGNEAYGDAIDPTIGFTTSTYEPGNAAPAIFCFQNQAASLLQEELELLRGRDNSRVPNIFLPPVYNRLIWNFTSGEGQVAYANNYVVETDSQARVQYPQGHGDAWGHYLTAIKIYYDLLQNEKFDWLPRTETVTMKGVDADVSVDFLDERKFAAAAAARARTGAEIVNLTYRENYVDDPTKQWQGYKDSKPERSWGLSEWAARAGQGAYLDWVTANAMLPVEDTVHTGIQKIDRHTVRELSEIASHFTEIENQLDRADQGLNPLGLAKDAIPFDIDPIRLDQNNETHFEQVYERAVDSLNNALVVFDYANQYSQLLRQHQDTLETYQQNTEEREHDFNNRLIEVFGYPYPDDIGPGKTYPSGYDGPDWIHYMYVDPSQISGLVVGDPTKTMSFDLILKYYDANTGDYVPGNDISYTIAFHLSDEFGFVKPSEWTGKRRAPGEIQTARSDLLLAKARFDRAKDCYDGLLLEIKYLTEQIQAQKDLNAAKLNVGIEKIGFHTTVDAFILGAFAAQKHFEIASESSEDVAKSISEGWPKMAGLIAGMSMGTIIDATAPLRGASLSAGTAIKTAFLSAAAISEGVGKSFEMAKEINDLGSDLFVTCEENKFALKEKLAELKTHVLNITTHQYDMYLLYEQILQAAGKYQAALAKGERIMQERERYRKRVADDIREYRYKDMAFRVFRNDAIQKYRAQFDLASMFVYLAAKAYDYETGLLSANTSSGERFMSDIVRQRLIGQLQILGSEVKPVAGTGLAGQLARMSQNFVLLKGQMGFNTPQIEETRFSLREQLLRILSAAGSDEAWRKSLRTYQVADLWNVNEYLRYCRPFAAQDANHPEPALVIPFTTNITSGLNFFGWPLSGGDAYYDASRFSTKIRSVGVWFKDYDTNQLSATPRIYFVPTGDDIIRVPYSNNFETRFFSVVDQIIPLPFPLGDAQMQDPNWIPMANMYENGQDYLAIRRHARMRAYPVSGNTGWEAQLQADSRLIGRSVWNNQWMLIIPGASLSSDSEAALEAFITSVTDILFTFQTYSYEGYYRRGEEAAEVLPSEEIQIGNIE